jgi:hypothetical protein
VKKIVLFLILLVFITNTINFCYASEILNKTILQKLDKKYLNLIDKNGKITNLKEFNKNGVVLVFEGENFDIDKQMYMFIEKAKQTDNNFDLKGTYTKDLLSDFKKNLYCNNETDEYIIPYVNITLDLNKFTFKEVIFDNFNQKQQQMIIQLYNKRDFDGLLPFVSGYVQCGVKIYSNKLLNEIKKLLKIN